MSKNIWVFIKNYAEDMLPSNKIKQTEIKNKQIVHNSIEFVLEDKV